MGLFDQIPVERYEKLVEATKDYLRTFNIEFDEDNRLVINDPDTNRNDYAPEAFTVNFKKSSPFAIKLLLGSLVNTGKINQENKSEVEDQDANTTYSSIGGFTLVPFGQSFNTLINGLSNTILHETLHSIINKNIKIYKNKGKLEPKVREAIQSLEQSFNRYKSSLNQEKLQRFVSASVAGQIGISSEELSKYYGATKLEEFISMLMTDQKFQKILNNLVADSKGKVWFEIFLDKLKKFFEALGFPINKNSVLATSIDDVLTIIESKPVEEDKLFNINTKHHSPKNG